MRQQNAVVGKGEGVSSFVHIHDAAIATVALLAAPPGVYNLVDDDPSPQNVWLPAFAKFLGAPVPPHMSEAEVMAIAGEDAVYYATKLSGASNAKAKGILGWKPVRRMNGQTNLESTQKRWNSALPRFGTTIHRSM